MRDLTLMIHLGDIGLCNLPRNQDLQPWRRLYIRSVYTFMETGIYNIRQWALYVDNMPGPESNKLSRAETALILEESYNLTNTGEVRVRRNFQEFTKLIRFTFKIQAKVFDINSKLDVNDKGWECLRKGLEIRNRITHPKSLADLHISTEEIQLVNEAIDWFIEKYMRKIYFQMNLKIKEKESEIVH